MMKYGTTLTLTKMAMLSIISFGPVHTVMGAFKQLSLWEAGWEVECGTGAHHTQITDGSAGAAQTVLIFAGYMV